ncbi:hypothetical protein K3495_g9223 [Podosphaera aphanis]|nr:hypothetical protein K3495_g9223 [Podosphaera aphanis]
MPITNRRAPNSPATFDHFNLPKFLRILFMPEDTRSINIMRSDYGTEDDRSSYGGRNRHPGSLRTVHRYHIKTRQAGDYPGDRHSARLETVPRSEYIDADRTYFIDDLDQCNSARELEQERSRVRTVIRERVHETDDCKSRRRSLSRTAKSLIKDKKQIKERRKRLSEHERDRNENYQHERRSSTPPPILNSPREDQYQLVRGEKTVERNYDSELEADEAYFSHDPYKQDKSQNYNDSTRRCVEPPRRGIIKRTQYSHSDSECSDDEYETHHNVIRKDRSKSPSSHHKRHLVEGALAGAGISALVTNRLKKNGEKAEHHGRNLASGAALGAVGAEVLTRARSQHRQKSKSRSRSRSTSRNSRHKLKKALGLAAAGIAATTAAQRVQNHKNKNDEYSRGRSRTRSRTRRNSCFYPEDDVSLRSRSKQKESKSSSSVVATGLATAAAAGLVQQARKTSRSRNRSQSRLRSGAEIASAGLAGAAVASLLGKHKTSEKKEQKLECARRRESNARSRTRARSRGRYSTSGSELELEMVQYGAEPVYANSASCMQDATGVYGSLRHRSRSRRGQRNCSSSRSRSRSRSRSPGHIRQIAGAVAGATVAALGLSQFAKRREMGKEAECERTHRQTRQKSRSRSRQRSRSPTQSSLSKRRTLC